MLILLSAILVLVAPLSAAGQAPQPAWASISGPPAPRISFQKLYVDGTGRGEILTASADGRRGVRELVPGMHNQDFCQSADGRKMAYYSNQETPHQFLPYVANADGANAQKVHGEPISVVCPFSERWLPLVKYLGGCYGPWALIRHDLQTGAEETVATDVGDRLSLSPDGNKLLFVGGLDYTPVPGRCPAGRETLNVLDLTTLDRRRLAGPLALGKSYGVACFGRELLDARHCAGSWSPDGRRIAYTIGPSIYADIPTAGEPPVLSRAHPYAVYVEPAAGGAARRVLRFSGGPPLISWSPDGGRLLVCAKNRGRASSPDATGCSGAGHSKVAGELVLVDLARGSRRVVSGKGLLFAQWAPSGGTYAYATPAAVYVARPDGARRLLAATPKRLGSGGRWMGWSPDGRYIGLGSCRGRLAVLDTTTGRIRVLFRERKGEFKICAARWWR